MPRGERPERKSGSMAANSMSRRGSCSPSSSLAPHKSLLGGRHIPSLVLGAWDLGKHGAAHWPADTAQVGRKAGSALSSGQVWI